MDSIFLECSEAGLDEGGDRFRRGELDCSKIGESVRAGKGREVVWVHNYRLEVVLEVRVHPQAVDERKRIISALEGDMPTDHDTERARTELATCEGEANWCRMIVARLLDDSLDDFPGDQGGFHGEYECGTEEKKIQGRTRSLAALLVFRVPHTRGGMCARRRAPESVN